jgi:excisionase family DNA binding protein
MTNAAKLGVVSAAPASLQPEDILTPGELAKRLKVPLSWVYKKAASGGIPILRCGRYLRFYWPDVCAQLRPNISS